MSTPSNNTTQQTISISSNFYEGNFTREYSMNTQSDLDSFISLNPKLKKAFEEGVKCYPQEFAFPFTLKHTNYSSTKTRTQDTCNPIILEEAAFLPTPIKTETPPTSASAAPQPRCKKCSRPVSRLYDSHCRSCITTGLQDAFGART